MTEPKLNIVKWRRSCPMRLSKGFGFYAPGVRGLVAAPSVLCGL